MLIISARLRELRERAGFSRPQLAQRSRISLRQIARIESGPDGGTKVRNRTCESLARALGIDPDVLQGLSPMPEDTAPSRRGPAWRSLHLNCDLVRRRYGVTQSELFRAAPLMFVLLAEGSLLWRREVAGKARELMEQLLRLNGENRGYQIGAGRIDYAVYDELKSVEKGDLRGTDFHAEGSSSVGYEDGDGISEGGHAFRGYLRHLVKAIGRPGTVRERDPEEACWSASLLSFQDFDLLQDDLAGIVGDPDGDRVAATAHLALLFGDVRIAGIPEELWEDESAGRRARWVVDSIPEEERGPEGFYDLGEEADDDEA